MLGLLGVGVVLITVLTAVGQAGERFGPFMAWVAVPVSMAINCGLFLLAFRALTARRVTVREVLPGAVLAAASWQLLQFVGAFYVDTQLRGSTQVYGLFAIVLGLLGWIYLEAIVVVLAAELNAVIAERLWPRALLGPFIEDVDLTDADRRSYTSYATAQRYRASQQIEVEFTGSPVDEGPAGGDVADGDRDVDGVRGDPADR
jgi:membrane protein